MIYIYIFYLLIWQYDNSTLVLNIYLCKEDVNCFVILILLLEINVMQQIVTKKEVFLPISVLNRKINIPVCG